MKKLILDIDTGIDDALAIAYAIAAPEAELIGVIGTYGNVRAQDAVQNSLNLLSLLHQKDVPVFQGEEHPLELDNFTVFDISKVIHGKDGIGEVYLKNTEKSKEEKSGVDFIIDSALEYQEDLIIVATGPMTDLAVAIQKEERLQSFPGKIVIMGGAVTVPGNCGPFAEANISQDPKAAAILFDSGLDITMVGLDVTLRTLMTREDTKVWREIGTTSATTYADIVDYYIHSYEVTSPHLGGCALHDPLAVAVAVAPDLVHTLPMFLQVSQDVSKEEEFGRTIGDPKRLSEPNPNVQVAIQVDTKRFLKLFMERLNQMFAKLN